MSTSLSGNTGQTPYTFYTVLVLGMGSKVEMAVEIRSGVGPRGYHESGALNVMTYGY